MTLSTKQIDQLLAENDIFLKAITEFQSQGKVSEVSEFQKRLQLNLLQLVDSAVNQFKTTQKNPNSIPYEDPKAVEAQELTTQGGDKAVGSLPSTAISRTTNRKKRSSFADMPII